MNRGSEFTRKIIFFAYSWLEIPKKFLLKIIENNCLYVCMCVIIWISIITITQELGRSFNSYKNLKTPKVKDYFRFWTKILFWYLEPITKINFKFHTFELYRFWVITTADTHTQRERQLNVFWRYFFKSKRAIIR